MSKRKIDINKLWQDYIDSGAKRGKLMNFPDDPGKDAMASFEGSLRIKMESTVPETPPEPRGCPETPSEYDSPILGMREWKVSSQGILTALYRDHLWEPEKVQEARCRYSSHHSPKESCQCGLYAYYDYALFKAHSGYPELPGSGFLPETIVGVVRGWGETYLAPYGFRSEYMEILALVLGTSEIEFFGEKIPLEPVYQRIADRYGVPLILHEEISAFYSEVGGTVLGERKPEATTSAIDDASTWALAKSYYDAFLYPSALGPVNDWQWDPSTQRYWRLEGNRIYYTYDPQTMTYTREDRGGI